MFKIITSILITNDKNEFLLAKRSVDDDIFPGLWSIPGGKVEHGPAEMDVLERNVIKEVKEEIGIKVDVDNYLQSHSNGNEKIYVIFTGHVVDGTPTPVDETDDIKWFNFSDIEHLDKKTLCPEIYKLLKRYKERKIVC